jgi:hypothetical protein
MLKTLDNFDQSPLVVPSAKSLRRASSASKIKLGGGGGGEGRGDAPLARSQTSMDVNRKGEGAEEARIDSPRSIEALHRYAIRVQG